MLILGGTRERLLTMFRSVEPVGQFDHPLGMPEESGQTLWLCRDILEPIERSGRGSDISARRSLSGAKPG